MKKISDWIISLITFIVIYLIDYLLQPRIEKYSFILVFLFGFTITAVLDIYRKIDKLNNKK